MIYRTFDMQDLLKFHLTVKDEVFHENSILGSPSVLYLTMLSLQEYQLQKCGKYRT